MMVDILRLPDRITLKTEAGSADFAGAPRVEWDGVTLCVGDAVTLTADDTPVKGVTLRWNGEMPAACRFCGDAWERGYGEFEWTGFRADRRMPWFFYAYANGTFALYGVKTGPDAICAFTADPAGVTLHIDVSCGSDGTVPGGRTLTCAERVFCEKRTDDPFAAACELAPLMAKGAVFPEAPVYGYNNWYFAYGKSCFKDIYDSAKELSELTRGLENRPYMVVDDCWQYYRRPDDNVFIGGDWRRANADFGDMKKLADELSALGVKPGLWFRPLQNKADYIPEKCIRDKKNFYLDPSVPETLEIVRDDVKTFISWGYKLIKHDYSTHDMNGGRWGYQQSEKLCTSGVHFANRDRTTAELIKALYKTIYDAAEGKAVIIGCNTIGHLGVGYMELNRTGDDTSGRIWDRTRKMGVNTLAFRMPLHRAFYDADADCVGVTPAVPWKLNRQWLELLARSGTPLFVSVAPGYLNDTQKAELSAAFETAAKPRPAAVPLDWLNDACPESWRFSDGEKKFDWYL